MMIQGEQIRKIEHKLRVILSQRAELDNGKILHVVRVYFSVTEKAFIVRITDPVSGAEFYEPFYEDISMFVLPQEPLVTMTAPSREVSTLMQPVLEGAPGEGQPSNASKASKGGPESMAASTRKDKEKAERLCCSVMTTRKLTHPDAGDKYDSFVLEHVDEMARFNKLLPHDDHENFNAEQQYEKPTFEDLPYIANPNFYYSGDKDQIRAYGKLLRCVYDSTHYEQIVVYARRAFKCLNTSCANMGLCVTWGCGTPCTEVRWGRFEMTTHAHAHASRSLTTPPLRRLVTQPATPSPHHAINKSPPTAPQEDQRQHRYTSWQQDFAYHVTEHILDLESSTGDATHTTDTFGAHSQGEQSFWWPECPLCKRAQMSQVSRTLTQR